MKSESYDIFISYRRDTGSDTAKHLRDILTAKGYSVFFDTDSLRSGTFNDKLINVINDCKDFILILSPHSLDRCVNEDDWVRKEISCALQAGKNIVPVMSNQFNFPDELPPDIDEVRWKNAVTVNIEYFDAVVDKLISFLYSKPQKKLLRWIAPAIVICILVGALLAFVIFPANTSNKEKKESFPVLSDEYVDKLVKEGNDAYDAGDYYTALKRYQEAAEQGNTSAQTSLGYMYADGIGVTKSYEKAFEYFKLAADQGNATAQNDLGYMYDIGMGVEQSYKKAFEYYKLSADQGNAPAQSNLGMLYSKGRGVDQSYEKAVEYYQLAAEQGNAIALDNLGFMYEHGYGVEQSYEKAAEYYQKAAEQGSKSAQTTLDEWKRKGLGPFASTNASSTENKESIGENTGNNTGSIYDIDAIKEYCETWNKYYVDEQTDLLLTYIKDENGQLKHLNILYNNANKNINYNSKLLPSDSTIMFAYNPTDYYFVICIFSGNMKYDLQRVKIDAINKEIKEEEIVCSHDPEDSWSFMLDGNETFNLYSQDEFTVILSTDKGQEALLLSKKENEVFYDMVFTLIKGSWYADKDNRLYLEKELLPAESEKKEEIQNEITSSYSFKNDYKAIDDAAQSLFYVEMYGADWEWLGTSASGFVSFDEHLFVTNQHVIDGAAHLKIWDEKDNMYVVDKVIASDKLHDLAILMFSEGDRYTSLSQRTALELRRGQPVLTIGSPRGLQGTVDDGIISSLPEVKEYGGIKCIQFSASISPGSSGGALFDNEGYVIGVTTFTIEGQNLNFAIPITEIQRLYNQWDKKSYELLGTEKSWNTEGT